ncbi:MAG: FtsX-like permease family protein [Candidatus Hermodarchaeota archaeon]
MIKTGSFFPRFRLILYFSRVGLNLTIITLIGLTIGLSMLSAALFQLDSTRVDFYFNTLEEFQEDLNLEIIANGLVSSTSFQTLFEIQEEIDSLISESNLENFLRIKDFSPFSRIFDVLYFNQTSVVDYTDIYGINSMNESILTECIAGSRLPSNKREVLVFVKDIITSPISLNDSLNISRNFDGRSHNLTLTAVGLLTPSTITPNSTLASITRNRDYVLITSLNFSFSLVQSMNTEIFELYNFNSNFYSRFYFSYNFDYKKVAKTNVLSVMSSIIYFHNILWGIYYNKFGSYSIAPNIQLDDLYLEFLKFYGLYPAFLILSIPIFIIVALTVSFSLRLINERREKALKLLKIRGITRRFAFLVMFFETLLIAVFSALLALVVGIPLSLFLGSSSGFLLFGQSTGFSELVITLETIQLLFLTSGVLTILLNLPYLVKLSHSIFFSLPGETEKKKRGKIRIMFGKLDLVLLTLGSIGVIIFSNLIDLLNSNQVDQEIFELLLPFFGFLLTFSPLFLLIGFVSTFNRFIPKILNYIGKIFWRKDLRLLAIATRNLEASINTAKRITLLITITFSLMIPFSILPLSYHYQNVDNVYYIVGGEISYSLVLGEEEVFDAIVSDLRHLTGFSFTVIKEYTISSSSVSGNSRIRLMGIEEDFAECAHWQSYYADESLESLTATLFNSEVNNSVIIDSKTMQREKLSIGSTYNIIDSRGMSITVSIQGIADYWPRMTQWGLTGFVITKVSHLENIIVSQRGAKPDYNTLIGKIIPGYNRNQIISTIKEIIHNRTSAMEDLEWLKFISKFQIANEFEALQEDNILYSFQWFIVNTNLLAGLVIILFVIILFAFASILRCKREIAISRSLGMLFSQVFSVVLMEQILLLTLSGITGGIVGIFLVLGIVVMTEQMVLPGAPFILQTDLFLIVGYYILLFLTTLFIGFVTSLIATHTNISKMLKAE